jgi:polysaccharide pyruvyl transferase WcaK-like protein
MIFNKANCLLWSPGIRNHAGTFSTNLGDQIIERAIIHELHKTIGIHENINKISTHQRLGPEQRKLVKNANSVIVGGSNLLSSHMDGYFQWDLTMVNAINVRRAILMGAGWWQDQGKCNHYTRVLLNAVLSWRGIHSVRDNQALTQLKAIGINNVLNTGCPTMWELTNEDVKKIRTTKGNCALVMLTDYSPLPETDRKLLQIVSESYNKVYFWPQGQGDRDYALSLGFTGIMLDHNLESLDQLLRNEAMLDYIGTRLHGGISCLKADKRCLTIIVDNRAREISRDTGLPTVNRDNFQKIKSWIKESEPIELMLPKESIAYWRSQFQ